MGQLILKNHVLKDFVLNYLISNKPPVEHIHVYCIDLE